MSMDAAHDIAGLRARMEEGTIALDEAMTLYRLMCDAGQLFPLEWEERTLRLHLDATPDRRDFLLRLRTVLILQHKPVPAELATRIGEIPDGDATTEDHQAASKRYHEAAGARDLEPEFHDIARRCAPYSMTSIERMYALYSAVRYIVKADVPGSLVECGVWRGGSMMVAAMTLLALGDTSRDLVLYDTFEGLPRPDDRQDVDIWGQRAIDGWAQYAITDRASTWARAGLEEVAANLASTGYPEERVRLVKGLVEETLPDQAPDRIALLRLDTDWYRSTRHEMEVCYPRLSPRGILLVDDYGHFLGARRAIDEYVERHNLTLLLQRVDYSGRMAIKLD